MTHKRISLLSLIILGASLTSLHGLYGSSQAPKKNSSHTELVNLFEEFRELAEPTETDGIPDYGQAAMAEQWDSLKELQRRLAGIDVSTWPVSQQVDHHLVRAEMNGLDFYHRVLQPWVHNPGFYDTELISGFPSRGDGINVFLIDFPLANDEVAGLQTRLQAVPKLFQQAKENLPAPARELAIIAIRTKAKKILMFQELAERLEPHHPELVPFAQQALAAVTAYRDWLLQTKDEMTFPAGVGKENFNWWMKNVWLYPHTWKEIMNIARREYHRAIAFLKLEENRNKEHPELQRNERPIRNSYPLFGGVRAEALSTFMEEGLMVAGLHDEWELNPRSREVIYISLAWRATRAIADLKLHSNEFTMDQALQHCVEWCPRGWECKKDMDTWYDLHYSMLQPGHATIYIDGKNEIERLMAERAMQLGDAFSLREFMDGFLASGLIPISLTRWEMTGFDDEIKKLR